MTTARDVMRQETQCVDVNESAASAAVRMAKENVGTLLVCDNRHRLQGIVTDRDIVVNCVARGGDPNSVTVGDLIKNKQTWYVAPDADVDEVLHQMIEHRVRRIPVLEDNELAGIISQADLAKKIPQEKSLELLEAVSGTAR